MTAQPEAKVAAERRTLGIAGSNSVLVDARAETKIGACFDLVEPPDSKTMRKDKYIERPFWCNQNATPSRAETA
ncbi:hypothetical protein SAMN02745194_02501 [Roseomonas rosea]|uniref:Uncharacterized protein n=1 Tax=Muricoccus roseus TaxID=198092 RepID=A0A1M6J2U7_9PROT|nr:hypothetical protein SAMN02745194_02501 [Roseomonas rosea]